MARSGSSSAPGFAVAIVATIAVALLPGAWRLGWQRELARLAAVPVRPFSHAGVALASWLRPAEAPGGDLPRETREIVDGLVIERDLARRQYLAEHARVRALEERIAELQRLPAEVVASGRALRIAAITKRGPRPLDPVEFALPRGGGGDERLPVQAIAVHRGVHLLGRSVAFDGTIGTLLPIGAEASGFLTGRIIGEGAAAESGIPVRLEPDGRGGFTGTVPRDADIAVGATVHLDDAGWSAPAQFMTIGLVESVGPHDPEPLLAGIRVRPRWTLADVGSVTLVFETGETAR